MPRPIQLSTLPMPLAWRTRPVAWDAGADRLTIEAGPRTDLFNDPAGGAFNDPGGGAFNAPDGHQPAAAPAAPPVLLGVPHGDFQFGARVRVGFRSAFDAGALLLWAGGRTWAKLAFEVSPQGEGMVVSVVTRGVSDDANGELVGGDEVWLRVARLGRAFAFHHSVDGKTWRFARHFALDGAPDPEVGFLAQSPTGDGCTATFSDVRYQAERLGDLRDGS